MIRKIALTLFSICLLTNVYGQNNINTGLGEEGNLFWKNKTPDVPAKGSPYIVENYEPIKIDKFNNQILIGRYNAYIDEMEVKLNDGKVIALDINGAYEVTFVKDNKTYDVFNYKTEEGTERIGYLVVLDNDKTLLKKEKIKYYGAVSATTSFDRDEPANFKRLNDDYYVPYKNQITYLPNKERNIIKTFSKHSKELKTFFKENKLKLKNEVELQKLASFISKL